MVSTKKKKQKKKPDLHELENRVELLEKRLLVMSGLLQTLLEIVKEQNATIKQQSENTEQHYETEMPNSINNTVSKAYK